MNGMPALAISKSQSRSSVETASNAVQQQTTTLSQKPLPSPPIARTSTTSPTKAGRSLLDASEKPLRRSPPGMPHRQEEWPTLTPRKTGKSITSNNSEHPQSPVGSLCDTSVKLGQAERFPVLGPFNHSKPGLDRPAISRVASGVKEESEVSMASLSSDHVRSERLITSTDTIDVNAALFQRSSIHESHHSASSTRSRTKTQWTKSTGSDDTYVSCSKSPFNENRMRENRAESHILQEVVNLPAHHSHRDGVNDKSESTELAIPLPGLQPIEESPKAGFEIKRFSTASSQIGARLKIFKSAEKVIMGAKFHDENVFDSTQFKNSRKLSADIDFHQQRTLESAAETDFQQEQLEDMTEMTEMANKLVGPSRLDVLGTSSSVSGVDNNDRKAKTVELSQSLSTNHVRQRSSNSNIPALRKRESFSVDDPFLDRRPRNANGKDCSGGSTVQISVPNHWKETSSGRESGIHSSLGRNSTGSINRAKSKSDQRKSDTEAQLYQGPVMPSRSTSSIEPARENSDPAGNDAIIIHQDNSTNRSSMPTNPPTAFGLEVDNRHVFPPRKSSRTMPVKYARSAKACSVSPQVVHTPQEAGLFNPQSGHESFVCDKSALPDVGDGEPRRDSVARESSKSHRSSSKGVISNIRGFFNKHSSSSGSVHFAKPVKKDNPAVNMAGNGSPHQIPTDSHPANRPSVSSTYPPTYLEAGIDTAVHRDRPSSLAAASGMPDDIGATMATAMQLLDSVRMEENSPQKERRLELGTILVQAITQAKEAEKAMEEAKHAARKADVAFILCKKSVRELAIWVERWRSETGN